jgi:hypothetical protein
MMDKKELEIYKDPKFMIMLRIASEEGAKSALRRVGLSDEDAGKDIHDLRSLIDGYRTVKKTATKTFVQAVVIFLLGLLSMGAYMKYWR